MHGHIGKCGLIRLPMVSGIYIRCLRMKQMIMNWETLPLALLWLMIAALRV